MAKASVCLSVCQAHSAVLSERPKLGPTFKRTKGKETDKGRNKREEKEKGGEEMGEMRKKR